MRPSGNLLVRGICAALSAAILAGGCTTVGPDYERPEAALASEWLSQEDPALANEPPVDPEWWKSAFHDPVLDKLVGIALAQNLSVRSAGLRVLQARQQLSIAIGSQFPQQQQLTGSAATQGNHEGNSQAYDVGFNLTWEIDVWGRFRRLIESASAVLDATVAEYDGVTVILIGEVARNYVNIRTLERRLEVARQNLDLQDQSVRITRAKADGGETSELDVDQAETLLHNTRAGLSGLELVLQQTKNSLAVLLGQPPHDMSELLGEQRPIPSVPPEIALGMPQDLIRRRPDIRIAERRLAAQSGQIGFAVSELYPHFAIGGAVGTASTNASDLFSGDSWSFDLFGAFQWNIFNYGRLKNNVRLQDALFQQLVVDYRETVLQAQREVENAIVAYLKSQEQTRAYQSAADAAQRAADVSRAQYTDGLVNFNTVITTLQSLARQQDLLASTQGAVANNLIEVYKSLGGGWGIREGRDPVALLPDETWQEMLNRTGYWDAFHRELKESEPPDPQAGSAP